MLTPYLQSNSLQLEEWGEDYSGHRGLTGHVGTERQQCRFGKRAESPGKIMSSAYKNWKGSSWGEFKKLGEMLSEGFARLKFC